MKDLKQVSSVRWETAAGDTIWKDDFGTFIINVNGTHECAKTFEAAVGIINCKRYAK